MVHDGKYAGEVSEIADVLRVEFADEARDRLQSIDLQMTEIRRGEGELADLIKTVREMALRFRGSASNFGLWQLGLIAHRLEDFLANVKKPPLAIIDDIQKFIDAMVDVVDGRTDQDADATLLVRGLPAKVRLDAGAIEVRDVEVLLVMLHGTGTHFVEREMQACGYRVSTCTSAFEALPMIVRTQPDMVIISAVMPELSGIDLAAALIAMPATRNVPCALITSLDPNDDYLAFLPDRVPVIHKGPSFADDLAEALSSLFLI
ncbi:response regulator receiver domain-containing protein [Aestuariispira insulae]|uniref:Response regulator receiver domain-containing protein n=2 Tax=Aestuariispira insulae TaxID=1461337 RepID=A0A3D9H5S0_9PROT|nr:response regulator receiver domain-containing protein [Aestuariispira insulae]